jgi:hypothetical protein
MLGRGRSLGDSVRAGVNFILAHATTQKEPKGEEDRGGSEKGKGKAKEDRVM